MSDGWREDFLEIQKRYLEARGALVAIKETIATQGLWSDGVVLDDIRDILKEAGV